MRNKFLVLTFFFGIITLPALAAQTPYCEVVSVAGSAQLSHAKQISEVKQGMMIQKGDQLVVGKSSSVDLAFDPEWNNTTHLNENTRAIVRWLIPTRVEIFSGDIYSKLEKLPAGSTFEIATPTAIAVARGTKFRTTYANGKTTVYNDSETSLVYVYHLDENGNRAGRAIVLKPGESTDVVGEAQVEDTMLDELQESRDREDQDQLNSNLDRSRTKQASDNKPGDSPPGGGGNQ